jgi:hypothetical protein
MKRHWVRWCSIIVGLAIFYILFFPSLTPEMAVRMSLLIRQPIVAFSGSVEKGNIENDPMYGDLYIVDRAKRPIFYVMKYKLGWVANAGGTAP